MRRNVTRIRITSINIGDKAKEQFMDKTLLLRHARNVGDEENVNNTVLGRLRNYPSLITFETVEQ
jgi:hypothetical protein